MKNQISFFLILTSLLLFSHSLSSQKLLYYPIQPIPKIDLGLETNYKITGGKVALCTGYCVLGALWGAREAYHRDPAVFEKLDWNGAFWSHNAWFTQQYNENGQHKFELGNTFRDFWHFSGTMRWGVPALSFVVGFSDKREYVKFKLFGKQRRVDGRVVTMLGCTLGSVISASGTYQYLVRKTR